MASMTIALLPHSADHDNLGVRVNFLISFTAVIPSTSGMVISMVTKSGGLLIKPYSFRTIRRPPAISNRPLEYVLQHHAHKSSIIHHQDLVITIQPLPPNISSAADRTNAIGLARDLGYPDSEALIDDDDFATRDEFAVGQDIDRLTGHFL